MKDFRENFLDKRQLGHPEKNGSLVEAKDSSGKTGIPPTKPVCSEL
jgi:hypothetical protein